jgi:PAS domain S-box-containing protein
LRQREEIYRKGADQASVLIFLVDLQTNRILESNAGRQNFLGYTTEELQQLALYDLFTHDQEGIKRNTSRLMKPGGHFISEQMYSKDGSLIDVEVSASGITAYDGKEAMCVVARDVSTSRQTEEKLRQSLDALLALYEGGHILGSTLRTEEVGSSLLQLMQRISRSVTAVISVPEEQSQQLRVWQAIGFENLWRRARYTSEVQAALQEVMKSGEHISLELKHPDSTAESLVGLFLPLRIRNRTIGVLEVYGPDVMAEKDIVDILLNLTVKAASALENAQLYGELAERERMLQELVGKLIRTQEEERRYVAYEVHDGLAQVAAAAHQHLQAFSRRYPPTTERGQRELERVLNLVRKTVSESRKVIANLRPTVLDDLGLVAAISLEVEHLHKEGYEVDYEDNLGGERLPTMLEITVFRIIQEALANFRKHAQTRHVRIRIQRREEEVGFEVQDYGRGFDPKAASIASGPGERVGLAGMQERVGMLNGELKIHSRPGTGTSITVVIPLPATLEED